MKRIVTIVLFIFCIISFGIINVSALNEIELKNISVESKSEKASIDILSFNDLKFNMDLSLYDVDDYVTYKMILKNNSNETYEIESITDNNELEYISNSYEFNQKEFKPNDELEVIVTTKYIKRIPKYLEEFNKSIKIKINYTNGESTIIDENPNTNDNINMYITLLIMSSILLIVILISNRKVKYSCLIIMLLIIIPSVYAIKSSVTITNNIKIVLSGGNYLNDEVISKSNDIDIEYNDDTKGEAFKFSHTSTAQTDESVDYRFIGSSPNNYVYYNCTDFEDTSTCELWRIMGVFDVEDENGNIETRTKIIPANSFHFVWEESNEHNNWETSTGSKYLNEGEYWNSLSEKSKEMIKTTKYYLGHFRKYNLYNSDRIYEIERSTDTAYNNYYYWIGKIGLIYASDFGYVFARGYNDRCYNDPFSCEYQPSWINDATNRNWTWTISSIISDFGRNAALVVNAPSYIFAAQTYCDFYSLPTIYLSKDVYTYYGDGTEEKPYQIRLNTEV